MAIQEGCHSHHWYHCKVGQINNRKCQIQRCFDLKELSLEVVMMGLEMRVGGKLLGWGESCGDGGAMKVV